MLRLLLALWACFNFACVRRVPPSNWLQQKKEVFAGEVFDGRGGFVSAQALRERLIASDIILVGESHGNACDHRFQAQLLGTLKSMAANVVLGMEQANLSQQNVLDSFHALEISLDELPTSLKWDKTWGFSFDAYAPVFEMARATSTRIGALSLPPGVVKAFREGTLTAEEKAVVPEKIIEPPEAQRARLKRAFESHPHGGDFDRFVKIQSLWDTHMARRAVHLRYSHNAQVLILAGEGHVSYGHGIGFRLSKLAPHFSRLSLLPWRGTKALDPAAADLFFYCPASSDE